jgi:hypothetical protein
MYRKIMDISEQIKINTMDCWIAMKNHRAPKQGTPR